MTYTLQQIADLYHVTTRTVKQWEKRGKLTLIPKPGGKGYVVTGLPLEAETILSKRNKARKCEQSKARLERILERL